MYTHSRVEAIERSQATNQFCPGHHLYTIKWTYTTELLTEHSTCVYLSTKIPFALLSVVSEIVYY